MSNDAALLLFGLFFIFGMSWNIYLAFQPGGRFDGGGWGFPPADRDHPFMFWFTFAMHLGLIAVGLDFAISACFGAKPWLFG